MNQDQIDQIESMLRDIVDNMDKPSTHPTHADFKRDWCHAVADVATRIAKEC